MIVDWSTYSRIDVTCENGNISGICKARSVNPNQFVPPGGAVLDFTDSTTTPTTKADILAKLEFALAWQNANFGVAGQQPAATYSHFELYCSNEEVHLLVSSKDGSGQIVTSPDTIIPLDSSQPFGDPVAVLLSAARDFAVASI